MWDDSHQSTGVSLAVERILGELVSAEHFSNCSFIQLPMTFPSGSAVTVRVSKSGKGYRVSDAGFAYRQTQDIGAESSFSKTATGILTTDGLQRDASLIYIDTPVEELYRAICDVGAAAWKVVDKIYAKISDEEQSDPCGHRVP